MANRKIPGTLTGIAGVHYVVSELSRRGMIALPTIRNTEAYDIIAASRDGRKHANIQVKTSARRVNFWPTPKPQKMRAGTFDYYVFLRWMGDEEGFEGFMLKGKEAKAEVAFNVHRQEQRKPSLRRAVFPAFHVAGIRESPARRKVRPAKLRRWKKTWKSWTLD